MFVRLVGRGGEGCGWRRKEHVKGRKDEQGIQEKVCWLLAGLAGPVRSVGITFNQERRQI